GVLTRRAIAGVDAEVRPGAAVMAPQVGQRRALVIDAAIQQLSARQRRVPRHGCAVARWRLTLDVGVLVPLRSIPRPRLRDRGARSVATAEEVDLLEGRIPRSGDVGPCRWPRSVERRLRPGGPVPLPQIAESRARAVAASEQHDTIADLIVDERMANASA